LFFWYVPPRAPARPPLPAPLGLLERDRPRRRRLRLLALRLPGGDRRRRPRARLPDALRLPDVDPLDPRPRRLPRRVRRQALPHHRPPLGPRAGAPRAPPPRSQAPMTR